MKRITFLAILALSSTFSYAQNEDFWVLERRASSNKTVYHKVALPDLTSDSAFEGKYFKIVKGKSNTTIRFDDTDEELKGRAANVYWHLSKARDYWVNEIKSQNATELGQVIVRLDIINMFDELGHFANDNRSPQYNNALSIPAGETPSWVPESKQDKWDSEIWFRPMKKIETKTLEDNLGPNPVTQALSSVKKPFINYTQNQFKQRLVEQIFYPSYSDQTIWENVIRFAGTIALTNVIIQASKLMDGLFVEKYYYLNTAMVPEVIYHEYSHLVLSDFIEMTHSTPVVEGYADYFAAVISNKKRVYAKVRGHSNSASKNPNNKKFYSHWDEMNKNATGDFTLSVMWDVRDILGEKYADAVIYEARREIKTKSATISNQLLNAILLACEKKCEQPRRDKLKLYQTFMDKGF